MSGVRMMIWSLNTEKTLGIQIRMQGKVGKMRINCDFTRKEETNLFIYVLWCVF